MPGGLDVVTSILSLLAVSVLAESKSPHVVLLVMDDVGWADVGYHGGNFPTPTIDALAGSGVQLDRFYVMPVCSPTRAAIMTGRYSFRTGMQHFTTLMPGTTGGIPKDTHTVAETFKAGGYATHMVGKWHLGYSRWSQTPTGRGFDSHLGYLQGRVDYYNRTMPSCGLACMYWSNKGVVSPYGPDGSGYDFWFNKEPMLEDFGKYTVDAYENRLEQIISPYGGSEPQKPLFLYFADQQLHVPLEAAPEQKYVEACRGVVGGSSAGTNRTVLCSMASRLDQTVAFLVDTLKKYGMWNDTLLFAVSDNGGMTNWGPDNPASASSNWPLRGGKTTVYEGGVRSVTFVNGGRLPDAARGTHSVGLMHAVDILPTLASFAGVPLLGATDGFDVWPTIASGAPVSRNEVPLNIERNPLGGFDHIPGLIGGGGVNNSALISWPWKVIVGDGYVLTKKNTTRRDGWWMVEGYKYEEPTEPFLLPTRLYNLEEDETERVNVADKPENQEILKQLIERVQWYASPDNGWMKCQYNIPTILGNPRLHGWVWKPFMPIDEEEAAQEIVV